jgi:hypothetical protein
MSPPADLSFQKIFMHVALSVVIDRISRTPASNVAARVAPQMGG